jgi:hypothetical protein
MVNEIDEIFAAKPTSSSKLSPNAPSLNSKENVQRSPVTKTASTDSSQTQLTTKNKKKRKLKSVQVEVTNVEEDEWQGIDDSNKTAAHGITNSSKISTGKTVEVVDASKRARLEVQKPPQTSRVSLSSRSKGTSKEFDKDALFKDSRGTGPRKSLLLATLSEFR